MIVDPWRSDLEDAGARAELVDDLTAVLTEPVLRHLPPSMALDGVDVNGWIQARDREAHVLTVRGRHDQSMLGLVFLVEAGSDNGPPEVHLGYLLGEASWGKGLATELVLGAVEALRVCSAGLVLGGVGVDNPASARVLEKAGFQRDRYRSTKDTDMFVLRL